MESRQLQHTRVTIIGGGRMGEAMASGWAGSGTVAADSITLIEPNEERRQQLGRSGLLAVASVAQARRGDITVLAVKPQVIDPVVVDAAEFMRGSLVVSVAAGVSCARLEGLLGGETRVVRVMPNAPAMVGEGMAVVSGGTSATQTDVALVVEMFDLLGKALALDERYQNAATAISGSGPAYFALVVDALSEAGESVGLTRETALELALQTMVGTAALLRKEAMQPRELMDAVSSPGGTTVAALGRLEEAGLREAFVRAVRAAVERAEKLGGGR